jgi:hypothetical protein
LMLRDRGCAFPGCTHTAFLHGHHIKHWLHGGETSLANTLLICSLCRGRHNEHYADCRIMQTSGAHDPWDAVEKGLLRFGLAA